MQNRSSGGVGAFLLILIALGIAGGAYYFEKENGLERLSFKLPSTYDPTRDYRLNNTSGGGGNTPSHSTPSSSYPPTTNTGSGGAVASQTPLIRPYFALTAGYAHEIVNDQWGPCEPGSCSNLNVTMSQANQKNAEGHPLYTITAIYTSMGDDSVRATKQSATASFTDGDWVLGNPSFSIACQPGRGHTDFSAELCF